MSVQRVEEAVWLLGQLDDEVARLIDELESARGQHDEAVGFVAFGSLFHARFSDEYIARQHLYPQIEELTEITAPRRTCRIRGTWHT